MYKTLQNNGGGIYLEDKFLDLKLWGQKVHALFTLRDITLPSSMHSYPQE